MRGGDTIIQFTTLLQHLSGAMAEADVAVISKERRTKSQACLVGDADVSMLTPLPCTQERY
jgi:hypothetical protein